MRNYKKTSKLASFSFKFDRLKPRVSRPCKYKKWSLHVMLQDFAIKSCGQATFERVESKKSRNFS